MLWIMFGIGALGVILLLVPEQPSIEKEKRNSVLAIFFLMIALVGALSIAIIFSMTYEETIQTDELELVSLVDNSEIYGQKKLFYVSIDTNDVYSFYYYTGDNSFKRGKIIDNDMTSVYETDNCTPHIEEYTIYNKNKLNSSVLSILLFFYPSVVKGKYYEIYVPKGTILRSFTLDSQ